MIEPSLEPTNQQSRQPGRTDLRSAEHRGVILHVITRYIPYGASRNLQFVLEWELRHGFEPHLAIGGSASFDVPEDVIVHRIPALRRAPAPIDDFRALMQIRRVIDDVRPLVLQTHQSKSGILGRLAARGKVPAVIHTIHMPSFGVGYGRLESATYRLLERTCARYTHLFVAVSDELERTYLEAGIGRPEQYTVIHSYIDLDRFIAIRSASAVQKLAWRTRFGIRRDGCVIVVAGLLEPRKRVDLVIRKLTPLLASGRATLVVAGDGKERKALEALAKASGIRESVMFLGFVSEFPEVLGLSDVLVHASTSEGVAQVVLQAAAAGTPVVATEAVGVAEIPEPAVTLVDRRGARLLAACESVLAQPPVASVPSSGFRWWSADVIDGQLTTLYERVAVLLQRRLQTK